MSGNTASSRSVTLAGEGLPREAISSRMLGALYARQLITELPSAANMRDDGEAGRDSSNVVNAVKRLFFNIIDLSRTDSFFEIGCHGAEASQHFVSGGGMRRAYAFEAIPAVYEKAVQACRGKPIDLFNLAIGAHDGEAIFYVPREERLKIWGSMKRRVDVDVPADEIVTAMAALDTVAARLDLAAAGRSAAIWMDVEGAALEVLQGATNFVSQSVTAIYLEMYDKAFYGGSSNALEIYALLIDLGFVPTARDNQFPGAYNMLAIHESVYEAHHERIAQFHIDARKLRQSARPTVAITTPE